MSQFSTPSNPTTPVTEPNKAQPPVGSPQTDAEKKAAADKAQSSGNCGTTSKT